MLIGFAVMAALAIGAWAGITVGLQLITKPAAEKPAQPPAQATCLQLAGGMSLEQKIGQLFMVGVKDSQFDEAALRDNHIGAVVYLGTNNVGIDAVKQLSDQIQKTAGPTPLLIAVDQEGGKVQRLDGPGFDAAPSAMEQARLSADDVETQWGKWGSQLKQAGVNYNLAPVADYVTAENVARNAPIGQLGRNYGTAQQQVIDDAKAAIKGMHAAGIVTAAKHFPGLGYVTENTDFSSATDSMTMDSSESIKVFKEMIKGGTDSVMISLATYEKIDKDNPAAFSGIVINELLRGKLGWQGVVISDDLGAAVAVSGVPVGERGIDFLVAGGDLIIAADMASAQAMAQGIQAKAEAEPAFAKKLDEHVARVLRLKNRAALVTCE